MNETKYRILERGGWFYPQFMNRYVDHNWRFFEDEAVDGYVTTLRHGTIEGSRQFISKVIKPEKPDIIHPYP